MRDAFDILLPKVSGLVLHTVTALHGMQSRSSDENSVRLFVCLSVCLSVCPSHAWIVTKR